MVTATLIDRLAALDNFNVIPRSELEWLASHGRLETFAEGAVVAPKGQRIEKLWIILAGRIGVRVDRGAGPKRVIEWRRGEMSGMLPYSRMSGPPGDNYCEEHTELLTVHERHFPAMISQCPALTAYSVHLMLDRARGFNSSDLQDEKMMSLGKLAAGLAHELNNPASATVRSAKLLRASLEAVDVSARALRAAGLNDHQFRVVDEVRSLCEAEANHAELSPLQRADRESDLADWLEAHGVTSAHAESLADTGATAAALDQLAAVLAGNALDTALQWIADSCATRLLAAAIEEAGSRIYGLVAAVKRFTYMDALAGPESVDLRQGLRDTLQVLASKMNAKRAAVALEAEPDLPRVHASGAELNQVWFSLLDNALDAIAPAGRISISAHRAGNRVIVEVADNGPGISPEIVGRIFDPFFTTKAPGQGTGLGLDIARRIIRRHHGDITVTSEPGRTEFRVSLPIETMSSTDTQTSLGHAGRDSSGLAAQG